MELPADDLIQQARMPIMIGVMKHEWGNRPGKNYRLCQICIHGLEKSHFQNETAIIANFRNLLRPATK